MDQSLDDYMKIKHQPKRSIAQRIGNKKSPIIKRTFIATQAKFDARQKLGTKKPTDARQKINKSRFVAKHFTTQAANDARSKINKSPKIIDARQRINIKKGAPAQKLQVNVGVKGRTIDARTQIEKRRQSEPKIIVTGLANPKASGNIIRTISNAAGQTNSQHQGNSTTPKIKITNDMYKPQPKQKPPKVVQPESNRTPIIQIKNDQYKPVPQQMPVRFNPPINTSLFSSAVAATVIQDQRAYDPPVQNVLQTQTPYITTAPQYQPQVQYHTDVTPVQYAPRPEPVVVAPAPATNAYINPQYAAVSRHTVTAMPVKTTAEAEADSSPQKNYRVLITNLHEIVSEDDIVELFGAVGNLKRARMLKKGKAEAIYLQRSDAIAACKKYHNRELDGLPMQVRITNPSFTKLSEEFSGRQSSQPVPVTERLQRRPSPITAPADEPKRQTKPAPEAKQRRSPTPEMEVEYQPLSLGKNAEPTKLKDLDIGLVNKALFKLKGPGTSRPVTFTVKI